MERRATAEYFMMMMINVFSYEEEKKKKVMEPRRELILCGHRISFLSANP